MRSTGGQTDGRRDGTYCTAVTHIFTHSCTLNHWQSYDQPTTSTEHSAIMRHMSASSTETRAVSSIPFHRFISGNEAHTDETNIIQEDRESVQSTENRQTHLHNYRSNFTKTLLLALQRATSDFSVSLNVIWLRSRQPGRTLWACDM